MSPDINLNQGEIHQIYQELKDPSFVKLLQGLANIFIDQDPKAVKALKHDWVLHRKTSPFEIKLAEDLAPGQKHKSIVFKSPSSLTQSTPWIQPDIGFSLITESTRYSNYDQQYELVFINVGWHDLIDEACVEMAHHCHRDDQPPSSHADVSFPHDHSIKQHDPRPIVHTGRKLPNRHVWNIPYVVHRNLDDQYDVGSSSGATTARSMSNPIRPSPIRIYDIVFGRRTFSKAQKHANFRTILVQTIVEAIQEQFDEILIIDKLALAPVPYMDHHSVTNWLKENFHPDPAKARHLSQEEKTNQATIQSLPSLPSSNNLIEADEKMTPAPTLIDSSEGMGNLSLLGLSDRLNLQATSLFDNIDAQSSSSHKRKLPFWSSDTLLLLASLPELIQIPIQLEEKLLAIDEWAYCTQLSQTVQHQIFQSFHPTCTTCPTPLSLIRTHLPEPSIGDQLKTLSLVLAQTLTSFTIVINWPHIAPHSTTLSISPNSIVVIVNGSQDQFIVKRRSVEMNTEHSTVSQQDSIIFALRLYSSIIPQESYCTWHQQANNLAIVFKKREENWWPLIDKYHPFIT